MREKSISKPYTGYRKYENLVQSLLIKKGVLMNRYQLTLSAVLLFVLLSAAELPLNAQDSQERVWKDKSGKFSVKASFVRVDGNTVFLRRSDNRKTIKVPLNKLSSADRQFLAGGTTTGAKGASSKSGVKLAAKMIWSDAQFGFGEEEPKRLLQLEIMARGKAAAEAIEFGMFQLESMTTDDGTELEPRKERFAMNDIAQNYKKVDRKDTFFDKHPRNGVRVLVDIEPTEAEIKKVAHANGTFKIKTGGEKSSFKIEKTGSMDGEELEMQEFEDLDLSAKIEVKNQMLSLKLDGNHSAIHSVEVRNPAGKEYDNASGSGESGGGSLQQYQFFFNDSVPEDAVMTVHVIKNAEEMEIPFDFKNLKVPRNPN